VGIRSRFWTAAALLVVGWALSAAVAPAFVAFARDRMHYGCFWVTLPGPSGWSCPPDAIPFEILVATEVGLWLVLALALVVVLLAGAAGGRRRPSIAAGLLVLASLPATYALLSLAWAASSLDPTGSAVDGLGALWWVAVGPAAAVVCCAIGAMGLAETLPGRPARIAAAAAAGAAWLALPLVQPGLSWLSPLGIAFAAAALLAVPVPRPASRQAVAS
jgi:hypothetical protein